MTPAHQSWPFSADMCLADDEVVKSSSSVGFLLIHYCLLAVLLCLSLWASVVGSRLGHSVEGEGRGVEQPDLAWAWCTFMKTPNASHGKVFFGIVRDGSVKQHPGRYCWQKCWK